MDDFQLLICAVKYKPNYAFIDDLKTVNP